MAKQGQIKFPFAIRTLEDRLELEKRWLPSIEKGGKEDGRWSKEWSETNKRSCEYRIRELELAIQSLRLCIYTKEDCEILNKLENE